MAGPRSDESLDRRTDTRPLRPKPLQNPRQSAAPRKKMIFPARLLRLPLPLRRRLYRHLCSATKPNPSPDPPQTPPRPLRSIIRSLLSEDDLDHLASEFKRLSVDRNLRSKTVVYEIIVRRLAGGGRLDAVADILEHHKSYADEIAGEGYAVRLISLYGIAGMPDHAAAIFRDLPALGCPRTVFSFNAVLTAFARSKAVDRIASIHELLSTSGDDDSISPNLISYNILINAMREKDLLDDALKTLNLMEQRGIEPDVITFNTLLNGFYAKGMLSKGDEIWERMVENGIQPDVRSFNAKIRGLALQRKIPEAMEVLEELKRVGLKPDSLTFSALIKGYCKEGKLEDAKRVYKEMGANGCFPDRLTLRELIPKLCLGGEVDEALSACTNGILNGFIVDVGIVQVVVDELAKASRYMKAKELVFLARSKNKKVKLRLPLSCLA